MEYNELNEEMQKTQGQDSLKLLRARVEVLLQNSKDAEFTVYLHHMQNRIANEERQVELLKAELDSRVKMYEHRMRMYQAQASQTAPQPAPRPAPMAAPVPQPAPQSAPMAAPAPQPMRPVQPQPQPAAVPARPKRSAEFIIGVAVLSVVGGVFILTSMVLLGMYFMEGLMKGLMLYVACIAVMVLAEAVLYRRWPRLGMTLSAIGMGGLYISTLINFLVLHNFNQWVALGLTLLITLTVILLSRKRDAAAYRILGMAAMYICILLVPDREVLGGGLSMTEFLTATVMALAVNIMCLAVPVKKAHTGIHVTHMALNTAFTFIAYLKWAFGSGGDFPIWQQPLFLAVSILVMHMIFVVQVRWQEKQTPGAPKEHSSIEQNMGICVTYVTSTLFYMLLVGLTTDFTYSMTPIELFGDEYLLDRLICSGVVVALCLIPMLILRKKQEKWFIWYALNLWLLGIHVANGGNWEMALCLLVMLVASKILSFTRRPLLYVSDAVVTTFACMTVYFGSEYNYVIPLAVGLVLSIFCLNYWHTYFQVILVFTIALYTSSHMLPMLKLPVFVGILFVGMLLFNNVDRWRGKGQSVVGFNALALGGQAICYLALINPVYRNAYLTYFCMLIFGTATIMICFQKKYYMDFGCKQLILAIFLTYMGLIVRTSYPITNSILLMLLALGCVAAGFAIKKKSVRIYGLVLSLVICGKLVLYDFMGANILQKTILFFAVGLLALVIAAIYMILERNQEKRNENRNENRNETRDETKDETKDKIGNEVSNEMSNENSKRSAE